MINTLKILTTMEEMFFVHTFNCINSNRNRNKNTSATYIRNNKNNTHTHTYEPAFPRTERK